MRLGVALLALVCLVPATASAAAEEGSYFTFAFGGGALVPSGDMKALVDPGLDLYGRIGWTSPSGLGLVLALDWAPLRRGEVSQSNLLAATAAPRFTLGRNVVRLWVAAGGGLLLEQGDATPTVSGTGGLDLHVFGNGGFSLTGGYTRSVTDSVVDFFSVSAGLVFTL